ncbi:MAG: DinB family protein [Chloroflexi bacterium]|nr:DinB family protein [Chloroflexota bacterium]
MNADSFRHLYNYHFRENRKLWDSYITSLSQDQFTLPIAYSLGSVRDHIVHLTEVDDMWFSELKGLTEPAIPFIVDGDDRIKIRQQWDAVEQMMSDYLADLRDEMLFAKPIVLEEDKDLTTWQVLLHVVNHGTDHRAQILRLLSDLGVKTGPQDFVFYLYEQPT